MIDPSGVKKNARVTVHAESERAEQLQYGIRRIPPHKSEHRSQTLPLYLFTCMQTRAEWSGDVGILGKVHRCDGK